MIVHTMTVPVRSECVSLMLQSYEKNGRKHDTLNPLQAYHRSVERWRERTQTGKIKRGIVYCSRLMFCHVS